MALVVAIRGVERRLNLAVICHTSLDWDTSH